MSDRLTIRNASEKLKASGKEFITLFEHGTLQVEIYKPDKIDRQIPHTRDEIYVIISGTGYFINGDKMERFEPGEILFVPAGIEHRFVDFSGDFIGWVFFYGPEGGVK